MKEMDMTTSQDHTEEDDGFSHTQDPSDRASKKTVTEKQAIEILKKRANVKTGVAKAEKTVSINPFEPGGFGQFLEDGSLADTLLVVNGGHKQVRGHRIILCFSSKFFRRVFSAGTEMVEMQVEGHRRCEQLHRVELEFPVDERVLMEVLRFMYTGEISINDENAVAVLSISSSLEVKLLRDRANQFISENITRENAIILLKMAVQFDMKEVIRKTVQVVAKNFAYIYDVHYNFLPYEIFLNLIEHEHLNIVREYSLFEQVISYVRAHRELESSQIYRLIQNVRYRWFTFSQLVRAMRETDPLIDRELLNEAAFLRLESHELLEPPIPSPRNKRVQPRTIYGITIKYSESFQKGSQICPGIIDWISTSGRRKPRSNPHDSNQVVVTTSSIDKGEPRDLVDSKSCELWTKDVPSSWFCTYFGPLRSVCPTVSSQLFFFGLHLTLNEALHSEARRKLQS